MRMRRTLVYVGGADVLSQVKFQKLSLLIYSETNFILCRFMAFNALGSLFGEFTALAKEYLSCKINM